MTILYQYYCPECHFATLTEADSEVPECPQCGAEVECEEIDMGDTDSADLD